MKPKKLVISAFGPYGEKTVVDFEKLGEKGHPGYQRRTIKGGD